MGLCSVFPPMPCRCSRRASRTTVSTPICSDVFTDLWSADKHRDLLPVVLIGEPTLLTQDARRLSPPIATPVGRSQVVNVTVESTGPDPQVRLDTGDRYDLVIFGESAIDRLLATAKFILTAIVGPLYQRFPEL